MNSIVVALNQTLTEIYRSESRKIYHASSGAEGRAIELAEEAIRLCRLLAELLPEPEVLVSSR